MNKHLAEKTIELAKEAWVHRNTMIITEGSKEETDRLLSFHDTLVTMANQLSEEVEQEEPLTIKTYHKDPANPILSDHVSLHMEKMAWSAKDLAEAAGVTEETVSSLLSGFSNPQKRTLRKIEKALELEEGHLDELR